MSHDLAAPKNFLSFGNTPITLIDFFVFLFFCNLSHTARNLNLIPHQIAAGSKSALSRAQQPIKKPLQCHAERLQLMPNLLSMQPKFQNPKCIDNFRVWHIDTMKKKDGVLSVHHWKGQKSKFTTKVYSVQMSKYIKSISQLLLKR